MARWIHPDFQSSEAAYDAAQSHWERVWREVLRATSCEWVWAHPWMNNPIPDGNPIFTAVCHSLDRGVRIIQEPPGDADDIDLDWWIDYFGDREEPDAVRELVIACCPSAENTGETADLLRQWVATGKIVRRGALTFREAELSGRGAFTAVVPQVA